MSKPYNTYFTLCAFICAFLTVASISNNADAQSVKPKLALVTFNQDTNDSDALKIAKKLNSDLFYVDPLFDKDGTKTEHFAHYLKLDDKNKTRFLVATVNDTGYFCTAYGCPIYLYQKINGNKWQLALSVQSHALYQDLNTSSERPDNLITVSQAQATQKNSVWLWNGERYTEAKRK